MSNRKVPHIAVMMSSYNGQAYIREQLNSLFSQTGVRITCFIRDDGSTDATIPIIKEYLADHACSLLVFPGDNLGCKASFRLLAETVYNYNGSVDFDYYAFCDQDDVWFPDKLSAAANLLFQYDPNKPLLYFSNLSLVDSQLTFLCNVYGDTDIKLSRQNALVEEMGTGCTMVFNRRALHLFSNFKPETDIFHDRWMYLLCIHFGEVVYDKKPRIYYRQHGANVVGIAEPQKKTIMRSIRLLRGEMVGSRALVAREFLNKCKTILNPGDIRDLRMLSEYNVNLFLKLKFLVYGYFCGMRMHNIKRDMWFRLLVIIGKI